MLLCSIIDELNKNNSVNKLLLYFFCQIINLRINTAIIMFYGLIYLFVNQHLLFISHVHKQYN